jgi:HAD superfamily hydrolase (TIGR01509 family)
MFDSQAWQDSLVGHKTAEDFWYEIGAKLGLDTPEKIRAFRHRYHSDEAINEGVRNLIHRLHGHCKLAILSNSPPDLAKWLADWKLLNLFDVVFCSGDEGVIKPDPIAFQTTLNRLGVEPAEAVFIDDTIDHVEAAASLGLHAIHFTSADALADALRRLFDAQGILNDI